MGESVLLVFLFFMAWKGVKSFHPHWLRRSRWYFLAAPFIAVVIVFTLFTFLFFPGFDVLGTGVEKRGQFGDSFSLLNSLFSGLGFAGLTLTLWLQQWQIRNQMTDSALVQEEGRVARYEATLHRLLDLYKTCVDGVV
jgi:hypothetical protein